MAIQNRRGQYADFDPSKAVPGELLTVLSGDPNAKDGKAVYMTFASGDVKRMATYEDMVDNIEAATEDVTQDVAEQIEENLQPLVTTAQTAAQTATTKANEASQSASSVSASAAQIATNTSDISDLKSAISETTRNLFDFYALPRKNGITYGDEVMTGTASSLNSAYSINTTGITADIDFEENTQYMISFDARNNGANQSGTGLTFSVTYSNGTQGNIACSNANTSYTHYNGTSDPGKTISKISIGYFSQGSNEWDVKNIKIEKGTVDTDYIPYRSASDYIVRRRLESTESNIAKIENQVKAFNCWNDFLINKAATTKSGVTVSVSNGVLTASGMASDSSTYFDLYDGTISNTGLVAGKTYYIDTGLHGKIVDGSINMYVNSGSGNVLLLNFVSGIVKATIPEGTQSIIFRYFAPNSIPISFSHRITFTEVLPNSLLTNQAELCFLRAWGTGDCTIIKFKNGENLVIDFGLNETQGTLQSSWATAISQMGITHIDYAIISHYHVDHVGMLLYGIDDLIDENTVFFTAKPYTAEDLEGLAWMDSMSGDHVVENYTAVTQILETAGVKRVYPNEGDVVYIGNAEVKFWNTNHQEWLDMFIAHTMYDYNHCSLCNYVTIGEERIAFTGDIGSYVMEKYKTSVLPSQIFKVNHHSAGYDVNNIFLNSLMPEIDITMLGHALNTMKNNSPNQTWCEANFVPNVVTGINDKTLILEVSNNSYKWLNSVRKCIVADEEALAGA